MQLEPDNEKVFHDRGTIYGEIGILYQSTQNLTESIARDPSNAELYAQRAEVYKRMPNHEKAIRDLSSALQLIPDNAGGSWKEATRGWP